MSDKYLHRHDLTDEQWSVLGPILPGQKGQWGGVAKDNRLFMNAVLWILRTGAPWRDFPKEFWQWGSVHQRFRRWRDAGVWERILSVLVKHYKFERSFEKDLSSSLKIFTYFATVLQNNEKFLWV